MQSPPVRHPPDGPLVGVYQAGGRVEAYLGVPFARPPVGALRWLPPQPLASWSTPRAAIEMAPACPQPTSYYPPMGRTDESCLFLNVFTAARHIESPERTSASRPVLVYIHGGSFLNGAANEDRLNASFTVAQEPDLVVVVVQYRLGVLSFSSGDALGGTSSGNFGIQDQRAALQWVRRSISAFGGDASRVLLAGQSAGAGSVSVHLVSPLSVGLFSRALLMSGAFGHWITQARTDAGSQLERLARAVGCTPSHNDSAPVDASCLRTRDAMLLVNASLGETFGPTVQTAELPLEPWALARAGGLAAGVPIMVGSTAEDGTSPRAVGGGSATEASLLKWIETDFGPPTLSYPGALNYSSGQLANLSLLYASRGALNRTRVPDRHWPAPYWSSIHLLADAEMACPARRVARWRGQSRAEGGRSPPAFWYLWEHTPLVGSAAGVRCAYHASEIPFLFHITRAADRQYQLNGEGEVELSAQLLGFVHSFAATGRPLGREGQPPHSTSTGGSTTCSTPAWPPFERHRQSRLLFRARAEGGSRLESSRDAARSASGTDWARQQQACDAWDAIGDEAEPIV